MAAAGSWPIAMFLEECYGRVWRTWVGLAGIGWCNRHGLADNIAHMLYTCLIFTHLGAFCGSGSLCGSAKGKVAATCGMTVIKTGLQSSNEQDFRISGNQVQA